MDKQKRVKLELTEKLNHKESNKLMFYSCDLSKMAIMDYQGLSRTVMDCQGLSSTVKDCQVLSKTNKITRFPFSFFNKSVDKI